MNSSCRTEGSLVFMMTVVVAEHLIDSAYATVAQKIEKALVIYLPIQLHLVVMTSKFHSKISLVHRTSGNRLIHNLFFCGCFTKKFRANYSPKLSKRWP